MHLKTTTGNFPVFLLAVVLFVAFSHRIYHDARSTVTTRLLSSSSLLSPPRLQLSQTPPPPLPPRPLLISTLRPRPPRPLLSSLPSPPPSRALSTAVDEIFSDRQKQLPPPSSGEEESSILPTVSILIPDWVVLLIVSPETRLTLDYGDNYTCVFRNRAMSQARFAGVLPFRKRITFKCVLPPNARRRQPFFQPTLIKSPLEPQANNAPALVPELLRWNFLVYDHFTTENDVLLFVKGVNNRQGVNRSPSEFKCVFGADAVTTAVTTSSQEVFRCPHPDLTELLEDSEPIKVTLDISGEIGNVLVPSVASYTPRRRRTVDLGEGKSLLCACTMVYNVAKFLKEWVMYHSNIGVERFILYDNDSDDDLQRVVDELAREGYDVRTLFWIWPKTQEAGFSHCALYAQQICTWMIFIDVDEFIFSPTWLDSASPSPNMLKSLLPKQAPQTAIGQVSIKCNEFGPSNQSVHPIQGVTQGYTCRRRFEQRHKSIVLLEAIDPSLMNAIHHFQLRKGYRTNQLSMQKAVVNHYKYQAWPEFKAKFRRRVSTYVVDWRRNLNLWSKDRTPGLGFEAIEPAGWAQKFCEARDDQLQRLTERWFGVETSNGNVVMAWER
ncbi:hypothetical protein Nepgr_029212 [Nepenthes gracilis]|uniref:Glycosyltransferase family 92 protein n=1 Tax=Nepenthes gracilis TaxID=150966 RepID=A0AAD3TDN3_NEPGR|nr:hypothetical protein Nepgr_029212 [Nepenthes gracilis]